MSLGSDRSALRRDGYKDGYVHSDASYEDALEGYGHLGPESDREVVRIMTSRRGLGVLRELALYLSKGTPSGDDLAEFIAEGDNGRRTRAQMADLFRSYLDAWKDGFALRWKERR